MQKIKAIRKGYTVIKNESLSHGEKSGLIQFPEANEPTELYAGKNCGKRYGSSCR